MTWILWALALMVQQASATWVSRARNSGSVRYHAIASIGSNGIWFLSQVFLLNNLLAGLRDQAWVRIAGIGLFYTVFCVIGSITAHTLLLKYVERGSRKVGAAAC